MGLCKWQTCEVCVIITFMFLSYIFISICFYYAHKKYTFLARGALFSELVDVRKLVFWWMRGKMLVLSGFKIEWSFFFDNVGWQANFNGNTQRGNLMNKLWEEIMNEIIFGGHS